MTARRRTQRLAVTALALASAFAGYTCAKHIGDGCAQNIDCSLNADRQCDLTQPGGYCTVPLCDPNGCPDNAHCVEFEGSTPRLARRYCVTACDDDTNCRGGYYCNHNVMSRDTPCPPDTDGGINVSCARILDYPDAGLASHLGYCVVDTRDAGAHF